MIVVQYDLSSILHSKYMTCLLHVRKRQNHHIIQAPLLLPCVLSTPVPSPCLHYPVYSACARSPLPPPLNILCFRFCCFPFSLPLPPYSLPSLPYHTFTSLPIPILFPPPFALSSFLFSPFSFSFLSFSCFYQLPPTLSNY